MLLQENDLVKRYYQLRFKLGDESLRQLALLAPGSIKVFHETAEYFPLFDCFFIIFAGCLAYLFIIYRFSKFIAQVVNILFLRSIIGFRIVDQREGHCLDSRGAINRFLAELDGATA